MSPGDIVAALVWLAICLVGRHELRAQRREDGLGYRAPGADRPIYEEHTR